MYRERPGETRRIWQLGGYRAAERFEQPHDVGESEVGTQALSKWMDLGKFPRTSVETLEMPDSRNNG